jgi:hypothetical protein
MRAHNRLKKFLLPIARAILVAAAIGGVSSAAGVPISWQHRSMTFNYVGFTTFYECDALESQVGRILEYFGARHDVKVSASCPRGPDVPSGQAWVKTEFYVPAQIDDPSVASVATAQWTPLRVNYREPGFIGNGDCELLQAMKDLVTKSFGIRDLKYSTSCFPHELTNGDFTITGVALKVPVSSWR